MSDFLSGIRTAAGWISNLFSRLWGVILSWPFVSAAVLMPFVAWVLFRLIALVRDASRFEVDTWPDTGLVGAVKRYKQRKEDKRKEKFAKRIFHLDKKPSLQWVDIDGQRFFRNRRTRRYSDGKRQTRKKE